MNIDQILLEQEISYDSVKNFFEEYNEDNYYKILSKISRFSKNDAKILCKKIIMNSNNKDIIDRICMKIIRVIPYDYGYYKEIICIISLKKIEGTWIKDIEDKLIENSNETIQDVFQNFSNQIPQNVIYDIEIII